MANTHLVPVWPVPERLGMVAPRLVVRGAAAAIEFYRTAFGAEEVGERFTGLEGEVIYARCGSVTRW